MTWCAVATISSTNAIRYTALAYALGRRSLWK